jgi:GTP-binding protein
MLIDKVTITVQAGKGGRGAVSLNRSEGNPKGGPDGGNGGNGGDIYVVGSSDLTALAQFQFKKVIKADEGVPGKRKNLFGKNADHLSLSVPVGTGIYDQEGNIIFEIINKESRFLLVKGGKGGRGNTEFKSSTNQTPMYAEPGEPGEEKIVTFELRLIAQIGLIGLPNAGKSTLLSVLTSAKPKIGNYAFTTLEPNVGMMEGIMIADIPGLIEGASSGKGLGFKFLKHIEKTELLVHCIDATEQNPLEVYETVRQEFEKFNEALLSKPEIVVLTKTDLIELEDLNEKIRSLQKIKRTVITTSVIDDESIIILKDVLRGLILASISN